MSLWVTLSNLLCTTSGLTCYMYFRNFNRSVRITESPETGEPCALCSNVTVDGTMPTLLQREREREHAALFSPTLFKVL